MANHRRPPEPMADTTDFRNGFTMLIDGELLQIVEFQHVKPGKGGAFVRTRLKNVQTGAVLDRTFRSGDKVEDVRIEKREMQYLYSENDLYCFMDLETYEQLEIARTTVGEAADLGQRRSCQAQSGRDDRLRSPATRRASCRGRRRVLQGCRTCLCELRVRGLCVR